MSAPKHRVVKCEHSRPKLNREVFRVTVQQPTPIEQVPEHKAEKRTTSLKGYENAVKDPIRHGLE